MGSLLNICQYKVSFPTDFELVSSSIDFSEKKAFKEIWSLSLKLKWKLLELLQGYWYWEFTAWKTVHLHISWWPDQEFCNCEVQYFPVHASKHFWTFYSMKTGNDTTVGFHWQQNVTHEKYCTSQPLNSDGSILCALHKVDLLLSAKISSRIIPIIQSAQ